MPKSLQDPEFQRKISLSDAYRVMEAFASSYRERGDTPVSDFLHFYVGVTTTGQSTDPAALPDFLDATDRLLGVTPQLVGIHLDDPVPASGHGLVEVTFTFSDHTRRWCAFLTPDHMAVAGDWLSDAVPVRFWQGACHLHVLSTLSTENINLAIKTLQRNGPLQAASLAY